MRRRVVCSTVGCTVAIIIIFCILIALTPYNKNESDGSRGEDRKGVTEGAGWFVRATTVSDARQTWSRRHTIPYVVVASGVGPLRASESSVS